MQSNYLKSKKIFQHYKNPLNFGILTKPTYTQKDSNPHCGDEVKYYLKVKNGKIDDIKFEARGCVLTIATASLLSEKIKGRKLEQVEKLTSTDLEKLLGEKISEARHECILLPLKTLQKLIKQGKG